MANKKPPFMAPPIEFEMADGTILCSLSYGRLLQLSAKKKALWSRYNELQHIKQENVTELDIVELIHIAYLCHCNAEGVDDRYGSFEEFAMYVPDDRPALMECYQRLVNPKKAQASVTHS